MLFKNPLLLAKKILRDQACCLRLGGKTPRYPTTLEISLPSMDHNRPHMLRKCWNQKDIDSSSMRRNLPKFNNLPTCSVTEQKIRPIFQKYLICSYLILPCYHRAFFHKFQPNSNQIFISWKSCWSDEEISILLTVLWQLYWLLVRTIEKKRDQLGYFLRLRLPEE